MTIKPQKTQKKPISGKSRRAPLPKKITQLECFIEYTIKSEDPLPCSACPMDNDCENYYFDIEICKTKIGDWARAETRKRNRENG